MDNLLMDQDILSHPDFLSQIVSSINARDIRSLASTSSVVKKLINSMEFWRLYFKNDETTNKEHRLLLARDLVLGSKLYYYDFKTKTSHKVDEYIDHLNKVQSLEYIKKFLSSYDIETSNGATLHFNNPLKSVLGNIHLYKYPWINCGNDCYIHNNQVIWAYSDDPSNGIKLVTPKPIIYAEFDPPRMLFYIIHNNECQLTLYHVEHIIPNYKKELFPIIKNKEIVDKDIDTYNYTVLDTISFNGKTPFFIEYTYDNILYIGLYPNTLLIIDNNEKTVIDFTSTPIGMFDVRIEDRITNRYTTILLVLENGDIVDLYDKVYVKNGALSFIGYFEGEILYITKNFNLARLEAGSTNKPNSKNVKTVKAGIVEFNKHYALYNGVVNMPIGRPILFYLKHNE